MSLDKSPSVVLFRRCLESTIHNSVDERPLAFLAVGARDMSDSGGRTGVPKGLVEAQCSRALRVLGQQRTVMRV